MNQATLQPLLTPRPVRFYASTASTMSDAEQWLMANPYVAHGAVVVADEQRQGRGRLQRGWLTPPKTALAMSIILRHGQHPTLCGALAVLQAIESLTALTGQLKFPNDVLIDGKKVAGILATQSSTHPDVTILGMGVNVAVDFSDSDLADKATSINHHLEAPIDRQALLHKILQGVDRWCQAADVMPQWKARLNTLGQFVTVYSHDRQVQGWADDVNADGALVVRLVDGTVETFLAGDVSLSAPPKS